MATKTPNYNLEKPDYNELFDIGTINSNMDIIDSAIKTNANNISTNKTSINSINTNIGNMSSISSYGTTLAGAIVKLGELVSSGKSAIVAAINSKGGSASVSDTFAALAQKIKDLCDKIKNDATSAAKKGNAQPGDVISGKTFTNATTVNATGTMPNQGAWNKTLTSNGSVTIPAGYHNGSGKVTANITTSTGTATAAQVLTGYTFSNSSSTGLSGSMANQGAWKKTVTANGTYSIPAGYHNGSGSVVVNVPAPMSTGEIATAMIGEYTGTGDSNKGYVYGMVSENGTVRAYRQTPESGDFDKTLVSTNFNVRLRSTSIRISARVAGTYAYSSGTSTSGLSMSTKTCAAGDSIVSASKSGSTVFSSIIAYRIS